VPSQQVEQSDLSGAVGRDLTGRRGKAALLAIGLEPRETQHEVDHIGVERVVCVDRASGRTASRVILRASRTTAPRFCASSYLRRP
jgi:hypothetical protein